MTDDEKPVVIQSARYAETEAQFMHDLIVRDMTEGVRAMPRDRLAWESGSARPACERRPQINR